MKSVSYSCCVESQGYGLYTIVTSPEKTGRYPVVVGRNPYVAEQDSFSEEEIREFYVKENQEFTDAGYVVVNQHCRGCGKSEGDFIPYLNERADGLALLDWIREQSFYNGEIFFCGGSYCASVFLLLSPYAPDIRGMVIRVQDSQRYNCDYRNGFYKVGLHGGWYTQMYKCKTMPVKEYAVADSFRMLPLTDLPRKVFGEEAPDFDGIIRHPDKEDPFWRNSPLGGRTDYNALVHARIPILLITHFYDIYTGGIFDMWNSLDEETRAMSALVISPYDHGEQPESQPLQFPLGRISEAFPDCTTNWFEHIRRGKKSQIKLGQVTYYRFFENRWRTEEFKDGAELLAFPVGSGTCTYTYDPMDPAIFQGGLCTNFGGAAWQDEPGQRKDILTFYTPSFTEDTFIKGKMSGDFTVSTEAEDTCFYVRLSLCKAEGDYGLRDDIQSLVRQYPDYQPGRKITLKFFFDEHAFLVGKGEKIRIDVSSSDWPHYLPHTNKKGLFCEQRTCVKAKNTLYADESVLYLPAEHKGNDETWDHYFEASDGT